MLSIFVNLNVYSFLKGRHTVNENLDKIMFVQPTEACISNNNYNNNINNNNNNNINNNTFNNKFLNNY